MADYYSTNAYSRSNSSSSNGGGNGNNNGYYSNTNNNNSNDFYSSSGNNNPYAQPTQQSSNQQQQYQPQYQPQQQQQQQQQQTQPSLFSSFTTPNQPDSNTSNPMPSLWNPTMATQLASAAIASSTGVVGTNGKNNEAIYKMGLQMGSTFLDQGTARLIPGLETFMRTLRVYFAVDNGYVKRKMMRVLCSFFCKSWSRLVSSVLFEWTM